MAANGISWFSENADSALYALENALLDSDEKNFRGC